MDPNADLKDAVLDALRAVTEPQSGRDVVTLGLVGNIAVCDGAVRVSYDAPPQLAGEKPQAHVADLTRRYVGQVTGVRSVDVEFRVPQSAPARPAPRPLPNVKYVVAVGAGKGGVGKSTVAGMLAFGLQRLGLAAGLLDADVYGPSIPKMTATEDAQPYADDEGRIIPPEKDGLKIMSMGYLVPPDQAIVWRGPMAQKYVAEFIQRGDWGTLDYLIVDLPPGTGDIPLTLAQTIPLTGAVVVCTPQDVALLDAVRALRMYQKLGVEPLGFVENMSFYCCPKCGNRDEIFGHGGAEKSARELGVPFLGGIPLNVDIRIHGDRGAISQTPAGVSEAVDGVVRRLVEEVDKRAAAAMPLPTLRVR